MHKFYLERLGRFTSLMLVGLVAGSAGLSGQAQRTISGHVTDEATTTPLEGAQVSVVGTDLGGLSDSRGNFRIVGVPAGDIRLSIRLIGYRTKEVTVPAAQNQVRVTLEAQAIEVQEIVVTGRAGTGVKRRNLANSVATLNPTQLERVQVETVEQAMVGKIAGANVSSHNGAPGGGFNIELRGVTSIIGDSRPLYVVDGVIVSNDEIPSGVFVVDRSSSSPSRGGPQDNSPNRIADINPQDIADIQILKGAAASNIYGSKASNGVILITTKRGQAGTPQYRLQTRLGSPALSQTLGLRRFNSVEEAVGAFGDRAAEFFEPGKFFDHERELAGRNPLNYEFSGSAAGGTENTQYFISGLQKNDGGIITGTSYNKQSAKVNLDQNLGKIAKISASSNAIRAVTRRGFTNNDNRSISYYIALTSAPTFVDLRPDAKGNFPVNPFSRSNPLQTAALAKNEERVSRFIGSSRLSVTPIDNSLQRLEISGDGGIDFFEQKNNIFTSPDLQFEQTLGEPGTSVRGDADSQFTNAGANLVHTLTTKLGTATTSAGFQFERRSTDRVQDVAQNLIAGLENIDRGTDITVRENRLQTEDFGFFVQEELLLGDKLLLTGGVRGDQSSNNADPEQVHYYPKASASYLFEDVPWFFDQIKLRFAFGESGNQPQFGQKFSLLSGGNFSGLQTLTLSGVTASPDLKPERQKEFEGGVDMQLFGGRASVEFTAFQTVVTQTLLTRSLPESTGFSTVFFNGGRLRNRGTEFQIRATPVQNKSFSWTSNTTFSLTRGKVIKLPVPPFRPPLNFGGLGSNLIRVGDSPTQFVGNDTLPDGSIVQNKTLGDTRPNFIFGFSNEFRYKGFTLFSLWDWKQGQDVSNLTKFLFDLSATTPDFADPCTASACLPGETKGEMRLRLFPSRVTKIYLENASFLKLRELSLAWNIPRQVLNKFSFGGIIKTARLSFSGRDLLTFTPYSGLDPEVSNFGNQSVSRSQDVAPFPPSRSFWVTMDVGL